MGKFHFEFPKICGFSHSSGQGIPEWDCARVFVNINGGIRSEKTKTMILTSSGVSRDEIFLDRDGDEVCNYFVYHAESSSCTALLYCFPPKLVEHARDTAGVVVAIAYISGSTPLDHLDLLGEAYVVRVPYSTAVFQVWPDQGLVGSLPTYF